MMLKTNSEIYKSLILFRLVSFTHDNPNVLSTESTARNVAYPFCFNKRDIIIAAYHKQYMCVYSINSVGKLISFISTRRHENHYQLLFFVYV